MQGGAEGGCCDPREKGRFGRGGGEIVSKSEKGWGGTRKENVIFEWKWEEEYSVSATRHTNL